MERRKIITTILHTLGFFYTSHLIDNRPAMAETPFDAASLETIVQPHPAMAHEEPTRQQYEEWVQQTIAQSSQEKTYAIIVDKEKRALFLLKDGAIAGEYTVDLGSNPLAQKLHQGDGATPEGRYRISCKKVGRQTIYGRSLCINYPTEEDRKRFRRYRAASFAAGALHDISIGGSLAIHGYPPDHNPFFYRKDWTDGCIALHPSDMEEVYSRASIGTMVTIVRDGAADIVKHLSKLNSLTKRAVQLR